MLESHVSEVFKLFLEMIAVMLCLALFFLGFKLSEISHFKSDVNAAIERQGGINAESMATIQALQEDHNGYFTITDFVFDENHDGVIDKNEGHRGNSENALTAGQVVDPQQQGTQFMYRFKIDIPIPFTDTLLSSSEKQENGHSLMAFKTGAYGTATSQVRTLDSH